jgi:hypothetical protein
MRQRNQVEAVARTRDTESATDHVLQLCTVDELHNRKPANGNDEMRPQNSNLIIHPQRTIANLIRRGDAIRAAGIFPGKTTADCGEINFRTNGGFVHSTKLFEPTEKRFPSSVRERPSQGWFPRPGRLSNDYYVAHDSAAGHWRGFHPWAASAFQQLHNVLLKFRSGTFCSHDLMGRSHRATQHARPYGPWARGYIA